MEATEFTTLAQMLSLGASGGKRRQMASTTNLLFMLVVFSARSHKIACSSQEVHTWGTRVNTTLAFLRNLPCWGLSRGMQCDHSIPPDIADQSMSVYTAERSDGEAKLRAVLVDKKYRKLTDSPYQYDAVLVLDPLPDANFGHIVFIFLINFDVDTASCANMKGLHINTGRDECIRLARRRHCPNKLTGVGSAKCQTNFIPLVHYTDDQLMSQQLQCRETLQTRTFATCRGLESRQTPPCSENSARCSSRPDPPTPPCTYEICDFAVLVAGGWNSLTSRSRYRTNLKKMWKLLHSVMRYSTDKIVTFYGQGQKNELNRDQQTNAYAVDNAGTVSKYIKDLCRATSCVDTLTIYLTGPSNSDGALLFWDVNGKGLTTDDAMLYTPKELLDDIKNCTAARIYLVADYTYSGVMIEKLKKRMARHKTHFSNLVVMSSSPMGKNSWRSDFTDAFIRQSRTGERIKCVGDVFQEVKTEFTISNLALPPETVGKTSSRTTLYGGPCNVTWEEVRLTDPCRRLNLSEWRDNQ